MSSTRARLSADDFSLEWLQQSFAQLHENSRALPSLPVKARVARLKQLRQVIDQNAKALAAAVEADFGMRAPRLTEVADLFVLRAMLHQLITHTEFWSRPKAVSTPFYLQPAKGHVMQQPLGVVGVMSPWNYPIQLALGPLATAWAAGNRVMLKPSELTPRTAQLLSHLLQTHFSNDEVTVHQGGGAMAEAFSALPFDHLFFTGSTETGRKVAMAAARNLTPTTLELGGKSPCIVDASASIDQVVMKLAHGKLLNGGQTCIAPDYVLLPQAKMEAFIAGMRQAVAKLFPRIDGNPEYATIISDGHWQRLQAALEEARMAGASIIDIGPQDGGLGLGRQMRPVLVINAPKDCRLLQQEIFGPVLPLVACETPQDAIAFIHARPRPLALYWFGEDEKNRDWIVHNTVSGGVCINDCLMHFAHENLPFGGVGDSGWGAYHGETGFLRMSMQKPVFVQSRLAIADVFYPPYGDKFKHIMGMLKRFM
jgi:coniferyl-aldehyde dehydrogenase